MLHRDTHTPIPPFEQQLTIGPVTLAADGESLYWLGRLLNLASTSRDLLQIVKHLGRFGIGRGVEDKRPPIETGNGENDIAPGPECGPANTQAVGQRDDGWFIRAQSPGYPRWDQTVD